MNRQCNKSTERGTSKMNAIDFDVIHNRQGISEKYDLRQALFGRNDVTPLWVADTDFAAPLCVQRALQARLLRPTLGYQEPRPAQTLSAIQAWLAQAYGLTVTQDDILLSPSVVTSLGVAIEAFTQAEDGVCVFTPIYPPFFKMTEKAGRRCYTVPLINHGECYDIDFDRFEQILPQIRLVLLSNPHNPAGRVWSAETLRQLLELCQQHDVLIFSDEIHSDLVFPPHQHTNLLSLTGAAESVILAHSIGKTFSCSGLRASFVVAPSPALRRRFMHTQRKWHTDDINCFGKIALSAALSEDGREYQRQLLSYLTGNIDLTLAQLQATLPALRIMRPQATFLVWADFRALGLDRDALNHRLIERARVGLSEGRTFGEPGDGFYRINVGTPRAVLRDALERMASAFSDVA
ncbi:MAG: PatB family C-S lyase [Gammaproteobacteria bacterium]